MRRRPNAPGTGCAVTALIVLVLAAGVESSALASPPAPRAGDTSPSYTGGDQSPAYTGGGSSTSSGSGGISRACRDQRRYRIPLRFRSRGRVIRAIVLVNGRRKASVRGRNLTRVTIASLALNRTFTVQVRVFTDRGAIIYSTRRYRNCRTLRRADRVVRKGRRSRARSAPGLRLL